MKCKHIHEIYMHIYGICICICIYAYISAYICILSNDIMKGKCRCHFDIATSIPLKIYAARGCLDIVIIIFNLISNMIE